MPKTTICTQYVFPDQEAEQEIERTEFDNRDRANLHFYSRWQHFVAANTMYRTPVWQLEFTDRNAEHFTVRGLSGSGMISDIVYHVWMEQED